MSWQRVPGTNHQVEWCGSLRGPWHDTLPDSREPSYRFLWHYHPEWEIVFSRGGRGTRHVGDSVEKFGPGDLVRLPGSVPHTWFSSEKQAGPTCCTVIHFLPEAWGDAFWSLPEVKSFHFLCQRALRGVRFTGEGSDSGWKRWRNMMRRRSNRSWSCGRSSAC